MQRGALILCGGESTRMGTDKALLPFGNEAMLQRVVRLVGEAVPHRRIVIVAAAKQQLPQLPPAVRVIRDRIPHQGPLAGLAEGLGILNPPPQSAGEGDTEAVFVTGCDLPLLVPAFVKRMFELLEGYDAVVPQAANHCHPLAAVYRPCVERTALELIQQGRRSLHQLIDCVNSRQVPLENLRDVDPDLLSLRNINTEEDYETALKLSGEP